MICSACAYYLFLKLLLLFKMGCCGAPPHPVAGDDGSKNRLLLNMEQAVVFYLFDFSLESASACHVMELFPSHHISLFSFFDTSS